jgi:hypothetical protein
MDNVWVWWHRWGLLPQCQLNFFSPNFPSAKRETKVAGVVNRVYNKRGDNFCLSDETVAHSSDALVLLAVELTQAAHKPSRNSNQIPDILRPNKLHMCVHKLMSARQHVWDANGCVRDCCVSLKFDENLKDLGQLL